MRFAILLLALFALPAFAQIPAASFDPQIALGKQTYDGLRAQVDIAQKQLATAQGQLAVVQSANTQLAKDLSDAQAKLATCKP